MALTSQGDHKYIPFKDSKLTRLLKDSLGGNSLTTLLCTYLYIINSNLEHRKRFVIKMIRYQPLGLRKEQKRLNVWLFKILS